MSAQRRSIYVVQWFFNSCFILVTGSCPYMWLFVRLAAASGIGDGIRTNRFRTTPMLLYSNITSALCVFFATIIAVWLPPDLIWLKRFSVLVEKIKRWKTDNGYLLESKQGQSMYLGVSRELVLPHPFLLLPHPTCCHALSPSSICLYAN